MEGNLVTGSYNTFFYRVTYKKCNWFKKLAQKFQKHSATSNLLSETTIANIRIYSDYIWLLSQQEAIRKKLTAFLFQLEKEKVTLFACKKWMDWIIDWSRFGELLPFHLQ